MKSTGPTLKISKLRFYEPGRNLPTYNSRGEESRFTYRFAQAYVSQFSLLFPTSKKTCIAAAREIPANGYGIADLVTVNWTTETVLQTSVEDFVSQERPVIRAFEVKMKNWRQALLQANRYRFFAHVPVVVVPTDSVHQAHRYIETFRLLGVGLWSFEASSNRIDRHFTPRSRRPADATQQLKVVAKVAKATRVLPVS